MIFIGEAAVKDKRMRNAAFWLILSFFFCGAMTAQPAVIDTYEENFDGREDNATIDGIDNWSVTQGSAVTQAGVTYQAGSSLKLNGDDDTAIVVRPAVYDDVTAAWIEFIIQPQVGAQMRAVPQGKIAALIFAHDNKIYASDAGIWRDTEKTFTVGQWYRVTLKLDFSTHKYDIYIYSVHEQEIEWTPAVRNLDFIDSSISGINQINFAGAYNRSSADDVYIDDIVIHFIDKLQITTEPYTVVAGQTCGPITVQLQNSLSEPQTAWKDLTLELSSTSANGEFSLDKDAWDPITGVVIPEGSSSASFYYKDTKEGSPSITVSEYPDRGWDDAAQEEKILTKAGYFEVSVSTPQIAGVPFTMVVTAFNEEGEIYENYSGKIEINTAYVSPDTGTKKVTPADSSGFTEGVLEVIAMYLDCGIIEITVVDEDDAVSIGSSGQVIFIPASFVVDCAVSQIVGRDFPLKITAYNGEGDITYNYQGDIDLGVIAVFPDTVSEPIISPVVIAGSFFNAGRAAVDASYNLWGSVQIKASDVLYPNQTGVSQIIQFLPAGLSVVVENLPQDRDFFYIGENIEISLSVVDAAGVPIVNYNGIVDINTTLGLSLPDDYSFSDIDDGKFSFVTAAELTGTYSIGVYEGVNQLSAQSRPIVVKQATLEVSSTVAPVGTAEVTIRLVDDSGKVITSENNLTITVELQEEFPDGSASSSASISAVSFKKGTVVVLISDSQSETVTISPQSAYKFKTRKGTVTFGRIAKTGVGTLLWREKRD